MAPKRRRAADSTTQAEPASGALTGLRESNINSAGNRSTGRNESSSSTSRSKPATTTQTRGKSRADTATNGRQIETLAQEVSSDIIEESASDRQQTESEDNNTDAHEIDVLESNTPVNPPTKRRIDEGARPGGNDGEGESNTSASARTQNGKSAVAHSRTSAARLARGDKRRTRTVPGRRDVESVYNGNPDDDDMITAQVTTNSIPRQLSSNSTSIPLPPPLAVPASAQSLRLRRWTQNISSRAVTGKWGKLSVSGQEAINTIIATAKRSVVQSAGAGVSARSNGGTGSGTGLAAKRIEEADAMVGQVARSLARRVPVMVLPIGKRRRITGNTLTRNRALRPNGSQNDDDGTSELFDIEAMVRRVARLEGELTTVLDAIKLADEEILREKEKVQMATEVVQELSENAQGMEKEWARWETQMPASVRRSNRREAERRIPDGYRDPILTQGTPFLSTSDPYTSLQKYISQLNGHPSSSQSDKDDEIFPSMDRNRAKNHTQMTAATTMKTTVHDPAFVSLISILSNHLSSLESNHEPVRGVADALTKAEVAVQSVVIHKATVKAKDSLQSPSKHHKDNGDYDDAYLQQQQDQHTAATLRDWLMGVVDVKGKVG